MPRLNNHWVVRPYESKPLPPSGPGMEDLGSGKVFSTECPTSQSQVPLNQNLDLAAINKEPFSKLQHEIMFADLFDGGGGRGGGREDGQGEMTRVWRLTNWRPLTRL